MTDDLVKRLRNPVGAMRPTISDGRLAADRIEALTAEVERMKHLTWNPADHRYWEGRYRDEAARAEADAARLRLLTEAAYHEGYCDGENHVRYGSRGSFASSKARAALKGDSHE